VKGFRHCLEGDRERHVAIPLASMVAALFGPIRSAGADDLELAQSEVLVREQVQGLFPPFSRIRTSRASTG
jgi:hypothetical protein